MGIDIHFPLYKLARPALNLLKTWGAAAPQ